MSAAIADLGAVRLIRAVRARRAGAFAALWVDQAPAVWSVLRLLCPDERAALGWMASFRMDLAELAVAFVATDPLGPQVGAALRDHLGDALPQHGPPGTSEAELAVLALPPTARLAWLLDLFFDLAAPGPEAAAVRARLDPLDQTGARIRSRVLLGRDPPAEAVDVAPGVVVVPPPRWISVLRALTIAAALAAVGVPVAGWWLGRPTPSSALHAESLSGAFTLDSDPAALSLALSRRGVRSQLTECPDLSVAGLGLVGARVVDDGAVVFVHRDAAGNTWTLAHSLTEVRAEPGSVVWAENGTWWSLTGVAESVAAAAEKLREARRRSVADPESVFDALGPARR
jgi:hypothetical protein